MGNKEGIFRKIARIFRNIVWDSISFRDYSRIVGVSTKRLCIHLIVRSAIVIGISLLLCSVGLYAVGGIYMTAFFVRTMFALIGLAFANTKLEFFRFYYKMTLQDSIRNTAYEKERGYFTQYDTKVDEVLSHIGAVLDWGYMIVSFALIGFTRPYGAGYTTYSFEYEVGQSVVSGRTNPKVGIVTEKRSEHDYWMPHYTVVFEDETTLDGYWWNMRAYEPEYKNIVHVMLDSTIKGEICIEKVTMFVISDLVDAMKESVTDWQEEQRQN